MNGRLVYFSSANGDGAPRIYTLAKHLGWDVVKAMAATKPLRVQTPQVITQVLERGERGAGFLQNDNIAWRSKLQGKPTDYVFPAEGRADRDRRLRPAQELDAAARRRALLRMVDGRRRDKPSSSKAANTRAAPTSPRPRAARRCRS